MNVIEYTNNILSTTTLSKDIVDDVVMPYVCQDVADRSTRLLQRVWTRHFNQVKKTQMPCLYCFKYRPLEHLYAGLCDDYCSILCPKCYSCCIRHNIDDAIFKIMKCKWCGHKFESTDGEVEDDLADFLSEDSVS